MIARAVLLELLRAARKWQAAALPVEKATSADEDYSVIRADYETRLFDAFIGYGSSGGRVTSFKNAAGRAIIEDFTAAFGRGYRDAGGEEIEPEDDAWLTERTNQERDYLGGAFDAIGQLRDNETITEDAIQAKVDSWLNGLDGVYAEGKLRGAKNVMLTYDGDDGAESCDECQKYKGQRHSAKWWINRDLVRRNGNDNYGCGRWKNCEHHFYTDDGEMYAE